MTMIFGGIVGLVLLSYLQLIQARTKVRARSLAWNEAIPVLESGIEEAFTHLQTDRVLTSNKWTQIGTNASTVYSKSRTNSDGSYFIATISNAITAPYRAPVIYSQGFVRAPLGQGYISRRVQVSVTNMVTFGKAIAAKGFIDLNGQTIVDSFDSSDTNYSTGGLFDVTKRKANGSIVTNSRGNPAVDVGNGHIFGTVDTGPGGVIAYNSSGSVGDVAWASSNSGVQPGYSNDDMNVSYPDQSAPAGSSSWAALPYGNSLINGTNYDYVISSENRSVYGAFTVNNTENMIVQGACNLYVQGDFAVRGYIYIAPGASLNLYVNGSTATFTGGGIVNATGRAVNFSYYGTTNNTVIKYSGQANFIGTVNAPQADFTISGGATVSGAVIVNSYTSKSAGAALHYDETLSGPSLFKLVAYREL
jgi:hypothetical protein